MIRLRDSTFIFTAFACYWISSISTVFLNKFFLAKSNYNFSILFVQNSVSALMSYFWVSGYSAGKKIDPFEPAKRQPLKQILMLITFVYITTLSLNNICLRLVTVSFFQVARSLNLISTVTFSFLLLQQKHSRRSLFCCIFVIVGFWLTVDQESGLGTLSVTGVIFGLLASVSLGVQCVLIRKALDELKVFNNPDALLCLYTNIFSLPLLILSSIISGELNEIFDSYGTEIGGTNPFQFWILIVFSGALTFCIAVASNACIRLTAPLSHNISVQTKSVFQTLLACWYFSEVKTWLWWIGNFTVVAGAASYTVVKYFEGKPHKFSKETQSQTNESTQIGQKESHLLSVSKLDDISTKIYVGTTVQQTESS